jgi:hypothetical protein
MPAGFFTRAAEKLWDLLAHFIVGELIIAGARRIASWPMGGWNHRGGRRSRRNFLSRAGGA